MSTTKKNVTSRPIVVRVLVWLGALGFVLAGYHFSGFQESFAQAQTSFVEQTPTRSFAQAGPVTPEACTETYCSVLANHYNSDASGLLPGWRWANATELTDTFGTSDALDGNGIASTLGVLFLSIAGWVWWILLAVARLAFFLDPLAMGSVGQAVNNTFYTISNAVKGLIWIPVCVCFLTALFAHLRGRWTVNPLSTLLFLCIPLGILFGMATSTKEDTTTIGSTPEGQKAWVPPVASPVWIAREGTSLIDEVTGTMAGVLSLGFDKQNSYTQMTPNCQQYVAALHGAYNKLKDKTPGSATMATLSSLWEFSFVPQWNSAQFNGTNAGTRVYCHVMEKNAEINPVEQAVVGAAAGYPNPPTAASYQGWDSDGIYSSATSAAGGNVPGPKTTTGQGGCNPGDYGCIQVDAQPGTTTPPSTLNSGDPGYDSATCAFNWCPPKPNPAYGPYSSSDPAASFANNKEPLAALLMWAGCATNKSGDLAVLPAWGKFGDLKDKECTTWWKTGGLPAGKLLWNEETLAAATGEGFVTTDFTNATAEDASIASIGKTVLAMHGKNAVQRLFAGLVAASTAIMYLVVLGMILMGLVAAKIGLMVMLAILPVTLLLLAMPQSSHGRQTGRNQIGVKLLKRTLGYVAAAATIQIVAITLVALIGLIRAALDTLPGGGVFSIAAPLVAMFVLKKLMKTAGLGDITKPMGALGLTAAAAAGATGAMSGQGFKRSMKDRVEKNTKSVRDGKTEGRNRLTAFQSSASVRDAEGARGKAKAVLNMGKALAGKPAEGKSGGALAVAGRALAEKNPVKRAKKNAEAQAAILSAGTKAKQDADKAAGVAGAHATKAGATLTTAENSALAMQGRSDDLDALDAKEATIDASSEPQDVKDAQKKILRAEYASKVADVTESAAVANRLGKQLSEAAGPNGIAAFDAAKKIAEGSLSGYVTAGGRSMTIGDALEQGFVSVAKDGVVSTTAKGENVGVQMGEAPGIFAKDGTPIPLLQAIRDGVVERSSSGALVLTAAGQDGGSSVRGVGALSAQARAHDPLYDSGVSSEAAIATQTRLDTKNYGGVGRIENVAGTGGVALPPGVAFKQFSPELFAEPAFAGHLLSSKVVEQCKSAATNPATGGVDEARYAENLHAATLAAGIAGQSPLTILEGVAKGADTTRGDAAKKLLKEIDGSGDPKVLAAQLTAFAKDYGVGGGLSGAAGGTFVLLAAEQQHQSQVLRAAAPFKTAIFQHSAALAATGEEFDALLAHGLQNYGTGPDGKNGSRIKADQSRIAHAAAEAQVAFEIGCEEAANCDLFARSNGAQVRTVDTAKHEARLDDLKREYVLALQGQKQGAMGSSVGKPMNADELHAHQVETMTGWRDSVHAQSAALQALGSESVKPGARPVGGGQIGRHTPSARVAATSTVQPPPSVTSTSTLLLPVPGGRYAAGGVVSAVGTQPTLTAPPTGGRKAPAGSSH